MDKGNKGGKSATTAGGSVRGFLLAGLIFMAAGLAGTAGATQKVSFAWQPSASAEVAGYNLYYGPSPATYTNMAALGNVTNATLSGLVEGKTYYFTVTAVDLAGMESLPSNEVSYMVPDRATLAMRVVRNNGVANAVALTASGAIPSRWAVQASSDLKNWTIVARGTNTAVNASVALGSLPQRFFRLQAE